jgi:hypothetical protein
MDSREWREHSLRRDVETLFSAIFDRFAGRSDKYVDETWPLDKVPTTKLVMGDDGRWHGVPDND